LKVGADTLLIESVAICEYLNEKYPEPALFPTDLAAKAKVRAIVEIINSGIQPLQNLPVIKRVEELKGNAIEWSKQFNLDGLHGNGLSTTC
jgi:glutathione S-transferase